MLSETAETAVKVQEVMRIIYSRADIGFNIYVSEFNGNGVLVLKRN